MELAKHTNIFYHFILRVRARGNLNHIGHELPKMVREEEPDHTFTRPGKSLRDKLHEIYGYLGLIKRACSLLS